MRLFVAAELPQNALVALAETSAALRATVPGRYVAPDQFHVTLAFLGEVEGYRVEDAQDAVITACAHAQPLAIRLAELGSFGKASRAALWQAVHDDSGELQELAANMRRELDTRGFAFDKKRFIAHVTLMRNADLTCETLPMPCSAEGSIKHVTLFRSDLSGPRPVYEPLHRVELGQRGHETKG